LILTSRQTPDVLNKDKCIADIGGGMGDALNAANAMDAFWQSRAYEGCSLRPDADIANPVLALAQCFDDRINAITLFLPFG